MTASTEILVIGGGVIGVCSAYYLAERGRRVALVEQGDVAAGCSYGNAGLIVLSHSMPLASPGALASGLQWLLDPESPFYIRPRADPDLLAWLVRFSLAARPGPMRRAIPVLRDLGRASRELYRELAALDGLECGFTPAGVLQVLKTRAAFEAAVEEAHLLRRYGLAAEAWDADRVRQREPNLRPGVVGGVYYPDDAHLDPAAFVRGLARLAEQKGVCLHTQTEVLGFETAGRSVSRVVTTRGDFRAEQVVIAAGSWSPGLARQLDLNLPIQAAKGYSLTLNRPPACPTLPLLLGEARVAVTPLDGTLRLAGTLELAGMDFSINRRRVSAIRRAAGEYLRGMDGLEPGEVWCGLRPCTPDGLPLIGRSEAFDNLIIAAGHAMVGMSLGPITGKLVAQLAGREPPAIDLTALRPGRFH